MKFSTMSAFKTLKGNDRCVPVDGDTLRRCQQVILGIAEDVIGLCDAEHICYQLCGGTAIGAVRHHGFIPWDDDIDICILPGDYARLKALLAERFGDKYVLRDWASPNHGLPFGKIMLRDSVYRDIGSIHSNACGFFIDVFKLENTPDNALLRKLHGGLCMIAGGLLTCRKFFHDRRALRPLVADNPELQKVTELKICIGALIGWLPLSTCARITNQVYGLCGNARSKYVSIPAGRGHYFGELYPRQGMVNTVVMPFEGRPWRVAKDYDGYLSKLYGPDYMTPPPVEKREHHTLFELRFPGE